MPKPITVSVDEVLDSRKDFVRGEDTLVKSILLPDQTKATPKSWNGEERSATFIMSAESEDRMHDVVVQDGLDLTHFLSNPQLLLFHNSRSWPVGSWSDVAKINGRPKRTEGKATLLPEGVDQDADRAARHVQHGTLRTVSIGFRVLAAEKILDEKGEWANYGYRFTASELLECSLVPIPALREARVKDGAVDGWTIPYEAIEQCLDNWAKHPETGLIIPRAAYEAAHREATGSKTSILTTTIELDTKSLDRLEKIAARMEKAADAVVAGTVELSVEPDEPEVDPVVQELELNVEEFLKDFEPKVDEIDEPERKSALTKIVDGIRGLFKAPEPEPEPAPAPADPEVQKALKERLAKIAAPEAA